MTTNSPMPASIDVLVPDDDANLDPADIALARCKWCLVVPTEFPECKHVVGPFDTAEEAEHWIAHYPGAELTSMASQELEECLLRERESAAA